MCKYYFDIEKYAIALQPSKIEELCQFPIRVEIFLRTSTVFGVTDIIAVEGLFQNLICCFNLRLKEVHQQLITCYTLLELSLVEFWYIFTSLVTSEVALFSIFPSEYVIISISKTAFRIYILV